MEFFYLKLFVYSLLLRFLGTLKRNCLQAHSMALLKLLFFGFLSACLSTVSPSLCHVSPTDTLNPPQAKPDQLGSFVPNLNSLWEPVNIHPQPGGRIRGTHGFRSKKLAIRRGIIRILQNRRRSSNILHSPPPPLPHTPPVIKKNYWFLKLKNWQCYETVVGFYDSKCTDCHISVFVFFFILIGSQT